jgi:uncharacterized protein YchJ
MRSRYAAFALGLGEYLADTLSNDHEDRAAPRAALVRERCPWAVIIQKPFGIADLRTGVRDARCAI